MKTLTLNRLFVPSLAFSCVVASLFVTAKPVQAVTINIFGNTVTNITTIFPEALNQAPWWGSRTKAAQYAEQEGGRLGGDPFAAFAYATGYNPGDGISVRVVIYQKASFGSKPLMCGVYLCPYQDVVFKSYFSKYRENYAFVLAPVPEPLTILGSIAATGFLAAFNRIKSKKKE